MSSENAADSSQSIRETRSVNPVREGLDSTGLYHSFVLPRGSQLRGAIPIEHQKERLAAFDLPDDLSGKRVLDIGPWDGFFAFEMERRGAEVFAIDYVDLDTFRALHRHLGSKIQYERMDVYELSPERVGKFDIVLCLGVLYHLKHPLLALEKICAITKDRCIIESFAVDAAARQRGENPSIPYIEFYEYDELAGQTDNWCGPTVGALEALVRSAGFASAQVLKVFGTTACLAAQRQWTGLPAEEHSLRLSGIHSHNNSGRTFNSAKEEYLVLWSPTDNSIAPSLADVFPDVDGYGVAPLSCIINDGQVITGVRLPPFMTSGEHQARLKIGRSAWSNALPFYVDLPPLESELTLVSLQDGVTWDESSVGWEKGGFVTLWVEGLSVEADAGNVTVEISGIPHAPIDVLVEASQVNIRLRPLIRGGVHEVRVTHRGKSTETKELRVVGDGPGIKGLELLDDPSDDGYVSKAGA